MALSKFTETMGYIQALLNTPTQDPADLKRLFDQSGEDIREFINTTLTVEIDNALNNKQAVVAGVDSTEIAHLNGVTSSIQTQFNNVQTQLSAKQAVVAGVDSAKIAYLSGVTGSIQTQLDTKQKNINSGSGAPTGGSNGDIYLRY